MFYSFNMRLLGSAPEARTLTTGLKDQRPPFEGVRLEKWSRWRESNARRSLTRRGGRRGLSGREWCSPSVSNRALRVFSAALPPG